MKDFSGIFKRKIYPFFAFLCLIAVILFWKSAAPVKSAKQDNEAVQVENYDIRADKSEAAQKFLKKSSSESEHRSPLVSSAKINLRAAIEEVKKARNLKIELNDHLQVPEILSVETGSGAKFLTAPSGENRAEILRRYIKDNSALFGLDETQIDALETTADYANPNGVLSFVHMAQKIDGVPVFGGEIKAGFTKRGEIFRIVNNLAPALDYQNQDQAFGEAETAVINAARHINLALTENDLKRENEISNPLNVTFQSGQLDDKTTAEKMYFPVRLGAARVAWRVLFWTKNDAFYIVVDARDGTLLWRKNITEHQSLPATFNVYGNATSMMKTADSPIAFTPGCEDPNNCPEPPIINRQSFTLVGNETPYAFNNLGWIPDTGLPVRTPADPNVTDGNNVEAGLDLVSPNGVDAPVPGDPFRVFNFAYNPYPGNPPPGEDPTLPEFRKGAVTQIFYTVNRWHDEMYLLGFNEQARNFQHFNFGRGGTEGDRISAEVQDSTGTNNINFSTPADGGRPRLQTFILTGTTPNREGALDAQTVVHELSHGVSSRLVGNGTGLGSNMSRGISEGWSDFYALALLSEPSDALCGKYTVGGYFALGSIPNYPIYYYGIRRFPTARISCLGPNGKPHSPLTFRHVNADCNTAINTIGAYPRGSFGAETCDQIHNLSEIWSNALWEVRGLLIDQYGAAEGNRRTLQYVTDAMKLSPLNPTFLQERDAIMSAAFAANPSDVQWIREGFRRRGMGFSSSIQNAGTGTNNTVVTESFDTPNIQIIDPFSVSDAPGDGDGYPEAGENVFLSVTITNRTGGTVSNIFVNADGGSNINVGSLVSGQSIVVQIPYRIPLIFCSNFHQVTLNAESSLGNVPPVVKQFRIGVPVSGSFVEFTNSAPINLPSGQPAVTEGAAAPYPSSITVSGLTGTKTIKVKLNGFHHEFEDDIDLLLVGPGGQKYVLMSDVGGSTQQLTPITFTISDSGDNFLPDSSAIINGLNYKPSNQPTADTFPAPAPPTPYELAAPSGSATFASVFGSNGAALNGTWNLYAFDDAVGDAGRIDGGWSLIFETEFIIICDPAGRARADFDGDGKTDMSVFRPTEGIWYLNHSTNGFAVVNWGLSDDVLVPGDYDGDRKADKAIKRGGDWYILRSTDNTSLIVNWGLASDVSVPGDYDGDGKTDMAVFRPSQGNWYVLRSIDGGNVVYNWGLSGDVPVTGDFDGDGKTDFSIYRSGIWYLSTSSSGIKIISFGLSSDLPVPGDYDGDNKDDIALFRPSNGVWYILRSSDSAVSYVQFGLSGDVPVPGDYDGDGKDDQAVYRNGTWYLNCSTAGFTAAQFGLAIDKPIPKAYIP